jgi:hypothetical protein
MSANFASINVQRQDLKVTVSTAINFSTAEFGVPSFKANLSVYG